ncbi:hypothetical protein PF008_g9039 [Phytophthora fragariae]|uniref:RxLR effector protein n=1 Tax=Phytophthora fragariae TaxID=53985 RepID=A0A6G0RYT0_9STRA|nr:hypothetical protein PF008_g9039 [Phytophthora fragariae]
MSACGVGGKCRSDLIKVTKLVLLVLLNSVGLCRNQPSLPSRNQPIGIIPGRFTLNRFCCPNT